MFDSLRSEAGGLLDRLRWEWSDPYAASRYPAGRIAIAGLPGSGKKTLCNSLWGWEVLGDEASGELVREYGLFTLADLPTDPLGAEAVLFRLEGVDLVIYVLDGGAGLRSEDFRWIARLRAMEATLVIVLNKVDLLAGENLPAALADLEEKLSAQVVPVSALDGGAVQKDLLPAVLRACPHLDVPLAAEIAGLRRAVAGRLILQSVITSALVSVEPVPLVDVSVLLGLQTRLIGRIAALHGYKERDNGRREILMSTALGLGVRYTMQTATKIVPVAGWLVSGIIGASATWAVGRAALAYYGAEFPPLGRWIQHHWKQIRDALPRRERL